LPVTTSAIGNTLVHGNKWFGDPTQRFFQIYFQDMAASSDGYVYQTTVWEEGHRSAGIYKNGDAVEDACIYPGFGAKGPTALAVTDKAALYWWNNKIVRFKRAPGQALDGKGGKNKEEFPAPVPSKTGVSSLAADEARDRLYLSDPDANRIRIYKLSDLSPVNAEGFEAPRPGKIALDRDGNLWVIRQPETPRLKLSGTPFGSPGTDDAHGPGKAFLTEKEAWLAKDPGGFVGLTFEQAAPISHILFRGGFDSQTALVGGKFQGSPNGKDGPWTDLNTIVYTPSSYPPNWITITDRTPFRAVRFIAAPDQKAGMGTFAEDLWDSEHRRYE